MNRDAVYEIKDIPLDRDSLLLHETIFHNANGYIGVRSNFEEGYPEGYASVRGSYINGFYDFMEMKHAEKHYGFPEEKQTLLNVVDSQGIQLLIDGETFQMFEGTVLESARRLHMDQGCTVRQVVWRSPTGKEVEIEIKRMASFTRLSLFTIEYSVRAINFSGEASFVSSHVGDVLNYCDPSDPRVAAESFRHLLPVSAELEQDVSYLVTRTSKSNLTVCTGVKNILSKEGDVKNRIEGHRAIYSATFPLEEGETVTLKKYTVFCDSLRHLNPKTGAVKEMEEALSVSLESLYEAQREYLSDYWAQASLEIEGDDELRLAVHYNLYQLIQSVGKDEYGNIAAKGLSGEGYEGHYFWDTEMYIMPFFTLTNPNLAKKLIEYRYHILNEARENAKILGHQKGALYPWRTIMGRECSGYFPAGTAQYHISGDVAYSVVAYYLATKDMELIASKGAEIVFETARLWLNTGSYYKNQFHIHGVTGPDEYTCLVNNNYFTNVSARYNLHWAVKFYHLLREDGKLAEVAEKISLTKEEVEEFEKAEKNMFLPYDEDLRINPQDDSFISKPIWDIAGTPKDKFPLLLNYHPMHLYRYQVCKQADTVLAHFIFEDAQSLETMRNSFLYYEKVTTHDSSLSTCIFSIVASKLALYEKAYEYFGDSAKLDLFNIHRNTKDGIHTANMGGNYMAIVYGFGGLRLKESGLYLAPALPRQWKGYRFNIHYEDSRLQVEVREKESVFTLLSGTPKKIYIYGEEYALKDSVTVNTLCSEAAK